MKSNAAHKLLPPRRVNSYRVQSHSGEHAYPRSSRWERLFYDWIGPLMMIGAASLIAWAAYAGKLDDPLAKVFRLLGVI